MKPLLLVYHEDYLKSYYTSTMECPARIMAIYKKVGGHFPAVRPEAASLEDLFRVHSRALVQRVQAEAMDSYNAALLAAGGAIRAAEEAIKGIPSFALVRPPGHHAGPEQCRGFCFFNNIAVAVSRLLARGEISRVLLLDLDLHHGDGTEAIFRGKPAVKVVNIGAGSRQAYIELLRQSLENFPDAELLAVSAGFDTYIKDWGGLLTTPDYLTIGSLIRAAARRFAEDRCFAILEGGYYLPDLGANVLAFCQGLAGAESLSAPNGPDLGVKARA